MCILVSAAEIILQLVHNFVISALILFLTATAITVLLLKLIK
jgi:hypothetical protein